MGKESVALVQILQAHHVIVRGGPEEGQKLLGALLVSCSHSSACCTVKWHTANEEQEYLAVCLNHCPTALMDVGTGMEAAGA